MADPAWRASKRKSWVPTPSHPFLAKSSTSSRGRQPLKDTAAVESNTATASNKPTASAATSSAQTNLSSADQQTAIEANFAAGITLGAPSASQSAKSAPVSLSKQEHPEPKKGHVFKRCRVEEAAQHKSINKGSARRGRLTVLGEPALTVFYQAKNAARGLQEQHIVSSKLSRIRTIGGKKEYHVTDVEFISPGASIPRYSPNDLVENCTVLEAAVSARGHTGILILDDVKGTRAYYSARNAPRLCAPEKDDKVSGVVSKNYENEFGERQIYITNIKITGKGSATHAAVEANRPDSGREYPTRRSRSRSRSPNRRRDLKDDPAYYRLRGESS